MGLQIRRGTNAERLTITPLQGELIFTTDAKKLFVGDGTTVGGVAVDTTNGGATSLPDLADVSISNPASGQVLTFTGSSWTNAAPLSSESSLANVNLSNLTSDQILKYNGVNWVNTSEILSSDLSPSLGGNLVTNGYRIRSNDNTNVVIEPGLNGITEILGTLSVPRITKNDGILMINSNQAVVIGSSSLNMDGNLTIVRNSYSSAPSQGFLFQQHHASQDAVNFTFYRSRGTATAPTAIQVGDKLADLVFIGHDGAAPAAGAGINVIVEGEASSGQIPTKIVFTTSNGITIAPRVAISADGQLQTNDISGYTTTLSVTGNVFTPDFLQLAVYADDSSRDIGIPAPTAGMMIFMISGIEPVASNQIQYYNGSTWVTM